MKLLLDTHILIWASAGTLPRAVVPFIASADNTLLFSPASIWELIKAVPKLQFWNSNLRFKGKSGHLTAFSKSLFQNQPGFGTSSIIKKGLGRPDFTIDPFALYRGLLDRGYIELDITSRHVLAVGELPSFHKDPFDRLLVAQARVEDITLLTADATVAQYKGSIIHVQK